MTKYTPPPPTRFGPKSVGQAKPSAGLGVRPPTTAAVPPPQTKFGPSGSAQAKPAQTYASVPPPAVHWPKTSFGAPAAIQPKAAPPIHWSSRPLVVQRMRAPATPATNVVVHEVSRYRSGNHRGKWYTTRDTSVVFGTKEEALQYHYRLTDEVNFAKAEVKQEAHQKRIEETKAEFKKANPNFKPPTGSKVTLFKNAGQDVVPQLVLTPDNAKSTMDDLMKMRRIDEFSTHVVRLNDRPYVLDKGMDIGIVPGEYRVDKKDAKKQQLWRQGSAKPYNEIGGPLDRIVTDPDEGKGAIKRQKQRRQRVGKDIDRLSRGSKPKGSLVYSERERDALAEAAILIRLDKARVRNATHYIRETITAGDHSFHGLLGPKKEYVGAGQGGVEALRGQVADDGYISEGSDIEEMEAARRKREAKKKKPPPRRDNKRKREASAADTKRNTKARK